MHKFALVVAATAAVMMSGSQASRAAPVIGAGGVSTAVHDLAAVKVGCYVGWGCAGPSYGYGYAFTYGYVCGGCYPLVYYSCGGCYWGPRVYYGAPVWYPRIYQGSYWYPRREVGYPYWHQHRAYRGPRWAPRRAHWRYWGARRGHWHRGHWR